ncbi:MAG: purine-binding chemotaxis protein CheW [Thermodesulfovibrionales bacterium]|nr:purine-binding chemotaxis protein CheW [Thermodesulfovibrionales bacterium]
MEQSLAFRLGQTTLGLDINAAVEVMTPFGVKAIPNMPDYIPGIMKIRGELVPLIDMRVRLGVEPRPTKERAIIVRSIAGKVGLLVDEVFGIMKFDAGKLRKPPVIFLGLKRRYLAGLYGVDDDVIAVLDMNEILSSEEALLLEKARKKKGKKKGKKAS